MFNSGGIRREKQLPSPQVSQVDQTVQQDLQNPSNKTFKNKPDDKQGSNVT